jgi:hypothetical protein
MEETVETAAYAEETLAAGSMIEQRMADLEAEVASLRGGKSCRTACSCSNASQSCNQCKSGGLYAGFAFVFARPHFKEAFQATVGDPSAAISLVPFSYDYGISPRTWLGYTSDSGLGVRTRYWQYDHAAAPFQSSPFVPAQANVVSIIFPATIYSTPPNEILSVADDLEVHTVDIEGTQQLEIKGMSLVVSGGLRYAMMRQSTQAEVINVNSGALVQALYWQRRFEGVGPTVGVEVERPIGQCGLSFIGGFHGSLLFGNKNLDRVEVNGVGPGPPVVSLKNAREVLGIGELQIGVQWIRQMACGTDLFVRGTYEAQLWSDSGTPTLGYLGFEGFGAEFGFTR